MGAYYLSTLLVTEKDDGIFLGRQKPWTAVHIYARGLGVPLYMQGCWRKSMEYAPHVMGVVADIPLPSHFLVQDSNPAIDDDDDDNAVCILAYLVSNNNQTWIL
jgi:hypothetical protein